MATNNKPESKFPALITYMLFLAAMVVGLILPLGTKTISSGIDLKNMPVLQLGGALVALGLVKKPPFGVALSPAYSYGFVVGNTTVNIGAILLMLYALVTLLAVIMFIPICVTKRNGPKGRSMAVVTEVLAAIVLIAMIASNFTLASYLDDFNLSVIIPLGVTIFVLMLQSIIYFKGSGVIKSIIFIISVISVFLLLFDIVQVIPKLAKPLEKLIAKMHGARPFATSYGLYALDNVAYNGHSVISQLSNGSGALMPDGHIDFLIVHILAIVLVLLVVLNLFLDLLGISKRTKRYMLALNLTRYIIEFVLVAALAVTVFWISGNFGIALYVLFVIAIIQLIIAIVRISIFPKPEKQVLALEPAHERSAFDDFYEPAKEYNPSEQKNVTEETYDRSAERTPEQLPEKTTQTKRYERRRSNPVVYRPAPEPEPEKKPEPAEEVIIPAAPAPEPEKKPEPVSTVIYNGPIDSFIRKLPNEERVEFQRVFLERADHRLPTIPEYMVGGNNSRFFSSIFIYYAHVRKHVSDGLMNKLYEEIQNN